MPEYDLPFISILIINFNGKKLLKDCLNSISCINYPRDLYETVLVDNASSDMSTDYVEQEFPWVKIIRFEKNYGFAEGYNQAVKLISSEYIALLNNDTVVEKDWLIELIKIIEYIKDDNVIAVGSKVLLYNNSNIIDTVGINFFPIGSGYDIGSGMLKHEYDKPMYIGAVCGCSMLVRRDLFIKIGGFDKDYFMNYEDVDFGYRCWIFGYKIVYSPKSILYHYRGGSQGNSKSERLVFLCTRNRLYNLAKNYELKNMLLGFFLSIIYDFLNIISFFQSKNSNSIKAIVFGYSDFISNLRICLKKRKTIQNARVKSDLDLVRIGLTKTLIESIKFYTREL